MSSAVILIIEDNRDNLDMVKFLLEGAGYTVLEALNGRLGLEIARQHKPALVLLDLSIPELDGWKLAEFLKKDPETAGIRISAMTGHTLPGDRQRAFDSGCDGYISKPLDVPHFIAQIEKFLK
jgi:two-component system cell cycle response regulator DivK